MSRALPPGAQGHVTAGPRVMQRRSPREGGAEGLATPLHSGGRAHHGRRRVIIGEERIPEAGFACFLRLRHWRAVLRLTRCPSVFLWVDGVIRVLQTGRRKLRMLV